jgi:hypothetical protein
MIPMANSPVRPSPSFFVRCVGNNTTGARAQSRASDQVPPRRHPRVRPHVHGAYAQIPSNLSLCNASIIIFSRFQSNFLFPRQHATGALNATYKAAANENIIVAVQIEHPDAVAQIEEIVREGIDVTFVRSSAPPILSPLLFFLPLPYMFICTMRLVGARY